VLTTDAQVRKLMEEMTKHGKIGLASMRAGVDRKTGRKYAALGKLPSERVAPRTWRTREDPFADDWPWVEEKLRAAPELEAKTLFEALCAERPGIYEEGQLRSLQRRVRQWRAQHGPEKEVFFAQQHRPGEAAQTDFTWATELGITIMGVVFAHMLCHVVLPYSNWEWATVCSSESMAALKRGVQAALFRLGRRPTWHQTDNSTAATHNLQTGKRGFNADYEILMDHLGLKPRTTEVGKKEQNGDVEASHGVLKRRLEQALLLRGHRDFDSIEAYETWVQGVCAKANAGRTAKVEEELAAMVALDVRRLPEHVEADVLVTGWSTIRVSNNTYSVPSRLIGETVRVRLFERRLEIFYGGAPQLTSERLLGRNGHQVNYRHVIWSLVQKPGAFQRYRYRDSLFPSLVFRRTYDVLVEVAGASVKTDLAYLRILHLAAATMQSEVEAALVELLERRETPTAELVRAKVAPAEVEVPALAEPEVDLASYDRLLEVGGVA
jgi:hypothetical protein